MSVRSDVGPLIDTWQSHAPQAYVTQGVLPDMGTLAAWMQKMLDTSGGLKLTRSADPLWDGVTGWLAGQGVDVERELARVDRRREYAANRAREAADRATSLAIDLKTAEKRLLFEARGVRDGAAGFSRAKLTEAQARVDQLTAALDEACFHDQDMARHLRRQVA